MSESLTLEQVCEAIQELVTALRAHGVQGYARLFERIEEKLVKGEVNAAEKLYREIPYAGMGGLLDVINDDTIGYKLLPQAQRLIPRYCKANAP